MAALAPQPSVSEVVLGSVLISTVVSAIVGALVGRWQSAAVTRAGVAQAIETQKLALRNDIAIFHLWAFRGKADRFRADLMEIASKTACAVLDGLPHTPRNIVFDAELATLGDDWPQAKRASGDFLHFCSQLERALRGALTDSSAWSPEARASVDDNTRRALAALQHLTRIVESSNEGRIANLEKTDPREGVGSAAKSWDELRVVFNVERGGQ
jgi:hypothetical protein